MLNKLHIILDISICFPSLNLQSTTQPIACDVLESGTGFLFPVDLEVNANFGRKLPNIYNVLYVNRRSFYLYDSISIT